jgi:2-oxoglutarate dehydrogenase E1 component
MQVCSPTTPAQYFHLLRRQIHRKFRKPLVLFMPKALLRYEPSFSNIEQLSDETFQCVCDDAFVTDPDKVRRVLLCTGKVYYTLLAAREKQPSSEIAIIRVEQLYPFPRKDIEKFIGRYRRAEEIAWVQEEPRNRGAWSFMEPRLRQMFPDMLLAYVGRDESASPAVGSNKMHQIEEKELLAHALALPQREVPEATQAPATSPQTAGSQ